MTEIIYNPEREKYVQAIETLDSFCDNDERWPYYDIKKRRIGTSVTLTIRFKNKNVKGLAKTRKEYNFWYSNKTFTGKSRQEVTIMAAGYVKNIGWNQDGR